MNALTPEQEARAANYIRCVDAEDRAHADGIYNASLGVRPQDLTLPAVGHMPFDHRTCAEWRFEPDCYGKPRSRFVIVAPRNKKLADEASRLVGRWR